MDYFEKYEDEKKELLKEKKEKEIYISSYKKQNEWGCKVCAIIFMSLAGLMVIFGVVLLIIALQKSADSETLIGSYVSFGMAAFFLFFGFLSIFISKATNYEKAWEKFKIRQDKGIGGSNSTYTMELKAITDILSSRIEDLEKENKELNERVRRLEQK